MRLRLILLLAWSAAAAPLAAQSRHPLGPGDVVRFSPGPRGVYTVQQARADSLVATGADGAQVRVPVQGTVIRRATGRDLAGGARRGMLLGAGAGMVVGGVAGYAHGDDPTSGRYPSTAVQKGFIGAAVLGLAGAVAGGAAGLLFSPYEWETATAPSARAALSPAAPDGRPGVVLTIRF